MRYDETSDQILDKYGILKSNIDDDCFVCGDKTSFIDTYFKVPSCSQECSRMMVKEIVKEVRQLHEQLDRMEKRLHRLLR